MQEKIRSYLSSLHNAVRSHDPYHVETLSSQNHSTLRIFSTEAVDPEEERRGPGPSSVFLKDKDSTHTFNNKGQNCMECKLNDLPRGHMLGHRLLDDIVTSSA